MKITGPFLDSKKKARGQKKVWYLRFREPKTGPGGMPVLDAEGNAVMARRRPYFETKAAAMADIPRIRGQVSSAGAGSFVASRAAQEEYEKAKAIVGSTSLVQVAEYWRTIHPIGSSWTVNDAYPKFLEYIERLHGKKAHYRDCDTRVGFFAKVFGGRSVQSITRKQVMDYLLGLKKAPRTIFNEKRIVCTFFEWLFSVAEVIPSNPAARIKRRQLPKIVAKEVKFLSIEETTSYLRAVERFDAELVAHEIVQIFSGVRADDEMADFLGDFVHPQNKQIVVPAEVAKTGVREVITEVEECFWDWWAVYGRKGLLRPSNHERRWNRVRVLSRLPEAEQEAAAALEQRVLMKAHPGMLKQWPWNARRRTFCTFHVAKYQNAEKTKLILRQRGSASTLHNSYRGLGVTQKQGVEFFSLQPLPRPR